MTTIDKMSFRRIMSLTGALVSERRRRLLLQGLAMLGIMLVFMIFQPYSHSWGYEHSDVDPVIAVMGMAYLLGFYVFGCIGASTMFSDLSTRQGRINTLMRPAYAIEKFASRWLIYTPCYMVVYAICVIVCEAARTLLTHAIYDHPVVTPLYSVLFDRDLMHAMTSHISDFGEIVTISILGFLALQSFFMLGSAVWPRISFVKTFSVCYLFAAVTLVSAIVVDKMTSVSGIHVGSVIDDNDFAIGVTLLTAATLINWALTWLRLGETDVITTKR